eukprot:g2857.t1
MKGMIGVRVLLWIAVIGPQNALRCFIENIPSEKMSLEGVVTVEKVAATGKAIMNADNFAGVTVRSKCLLTSQTISEKPYVEDATSGTFRFEVYHRQCAGVDGRGGDIEICVLSNMQEDAAQGVEYLKTSFEFFLRGVDAAISSADENGQAHVEHVDNIANQVQRLTKRVENIHQHLTSYRELEKQIRTVSEKNNARVAWLSVLQAILLLCAGIWQIYHLKLFFKAKKLV